MNTLTDIRNVAVNVTDQDAALGKHPGDTVTVHLTKRHPPK